MSERVKIVDQVVTADGELIVLKADRNRKKVVVDLIRSSGAVELAAFTNEEAELLAKHLHTSLDLVDVKAIIKKMWGT